MKVNFNTLKREGNGLIKYKLNVADTEHIFCYEYKGLYFHFKMIKGELVTINNKPAKTELINSSKVKGKFFDEYYNSSLNQFYTK